MPRLPPVTRTVCWARWSWGSSAEVGTPICVRSCKVHRSVYFWQAAPYHRGMTSRRPRKPGRPRTPRRRRRAGSSTHDGIHAVGVDRLCAVAGVSKRSLYQHFAGKDDVVAAMLESSRGALPAGPREPSGIRPASGSWPSSTTLEAGRRLRASSAGCPFVAAAVELKDPDHPAAVVARREKQALHRPPRAPGDRGRGHATPRRSPSS